ncbi:MAG: hypothetical protein ACI865_002443 [Flavobacteriaceae bacterium]|jgi:hypothetical protein
MKKLQLILIALILFPTALFAQLPMEVWETIDAYQSPGIGITVRHSINDDAGNTYSTGYFYGPSSDHDMFVSKHDNNGNLVFNDTYDSGIGYDWGIEVEYDDSGNTYVVANIRGATVFEASAVMTRKYGPTGTLLWSSSYTSAILSAKANDMQVHPTTGEVYIIGYSANQVTADEKNIMVLKYLTDGTLSWSKAFDGGSGIDDIGYMMKLDNTGSIYVLGETNAAVLGSPGTNILLKYTTTGALSWSETPQTSGEQGGAVMRNEGTNISVYDFFTKQRYTKSTGLLNETITFENAAQITSAILRYWKLSDGRYVRTMTSNSIRVYDATGTELSSTFIPQYTDIQMDSDNSLYLCSVATGDSAQVLRRHLVGDSYNWVDFTYRFYQASGGWPKFDLSDNNTFTVASQYSNGSVITHRACIPPNVSVTMTGLDISGNVCPGDTVFFNAVSDYANSYSWWGNNSGSNTDSMYIWGGNFPFITPLNLGLIVDAGNGCMVDVDMDFGGYQIIDTYIVDNFVGNCENDQGYLQSLSAGAIYRFNWYYNGVQQTFDALDYNYYLTLGNGAYELALLDTQTGCRSIPHATVNVTTILPQEDASYSYALANYCPSASDPTPTITGNSGGTFTATPAGLLINASTGEIDLSLSTTGPYAVSYATNGTCPDTVEFNLSIEALEDASFSYASVNFCENAPNALVTISGTLGGTFSVTPAGLNINPSTGEIDFSLSTANTYLVDYQTNGACSVSSQVNVTVTLEDIASVSYSALNYCQDDADPTPSITGTLGGTFSVSPAGLVINSSTGEIDLSLSTPAAYSVKYLTNGSCPDSVSGTITINALDNAGFSFASLNYCGNDANVFPAITGTLGGTFSATPAGLSINPSTGEINFGTSSASSYTITYLTNGTCPVASQVNVTVTLEDIALMWYPVSNYCQDEADPTPSIAGTLGGTFSSSPLGLVINSSTGEVDLSLSTPAAYSIKYLTNGPCPDSTTGIITINALDNAGFTFPSLNYCENDVNALPTISGTPGGTFSATPAGLNINPATGEIDFSLSTVNTYLVDYLTNGVCSVSSQVNVTVTSEDVAAVSYAALNYCQNEVDPIPSITGTLGGTFSATPAGLSINPSTGEVNLATSTPNTYTIEYLTGGICPDSTNSAITIDVLDDASFTYGTGTFCLTGSNPLPAISGLGGGTFSGTGGVVINGSTGEIDVVSSGIGNFTISYQTNGNCPNSTDFNLVITDSPDASFSYSPIVFCISELPISVQFGVGASGGTFSAVPSGLSINPSTGEIDPTASTPNVYTVTNFIAASGGCAMASSDFQVEVVVSDDASFSYSQSNYLTSDPNPLPTIIGLPGGTFSEPSGNVSLNGLTGEIDLALSVIGGPYTIEYLTNGSCPSMESFDLTIEEPLSLSDQEFGHVVIYPNPVSNILYIDSEEPIELVEIYDLNGRLVSQVSETKNIDVSHLKPAIYIIVLRSNNAVYQTKMIKK